MEYSTVTIRKYKDQWSVDHQRGEQYVGYLNFDTFRDCVAYARTLDAGCVVAQVAHGKYRRGHQLAL